MRGNTKVLFFVLFFQKFGSHSNCLSKMQEKKKRQIKAERRAGLPGEKWRDSVAVLTTLLNGRIDEVDTQLINDIE